MESHKPTQKNSHFLYVNKCVLFVYIQQEKDKEKKKEKQNKQIITSRHLYIIYIN